MASDDIVYGFNRFDANELADGLGGKERSIPGFVSQGKKLKLVRFTLTAALASGGTATATTTPGSESITVTDWAGNAAKSGDKGVAWKDGDTYRVIEIKNFVTELVRFVLAEDIDAISRRAGATIESSGADDGTSIEVWDYCLNGGVTGNKGVAWKTKYTDPETDEIEDVYVIIEITQSAGKFIQGVMASGGASFGGTSVATFSLTTIEGIDAPWTGASTIEVQNPLFKKVWVGDCLIRCQFNVTTNQWEVTDATSKYVVHGVRINEGCVFEKLDYNGTVNWNDAVDWTTDPVVIGTPADWVTSVYVEDMQLKYDERCVPGVLIVNLTDCEEAP